MSDAASERFKALVLRWMREEGATGRLRWDNIEKATEVVAVETYGTDWAGDTEGGFYSEADTAITFMVETAKKTVTLTGEDLASLWQFIMREV